MKIAFVSRSNAVRSIMAEAVARRLFRELALKADIFSAGVEPAPEVHPLTLMILEEKGYPVKGLRPKRLSDIPYGKLDILITIGNTAKERCEFVLSHKRREGWFIESPSESADAFRRTLEEIEEHMKSLLKL